MAAKPHLVYMIPDCVGSVRVFSQRSVRCFIRPVVLNF